MDIDECLSNPCLNRADCDDSNSTVAFYGRSSRRFFVSDGLIPIDDYGCTCRPG